MTGSRYLPRAGAAFFLTAAVTLPGAALPTQAASATAEAGGGVAVAAVPASRQATAVYPAEDALVRFGMPAGTTPSSDAGLPAAGQRPSGAERLSRPQILAGLAAPAAASRVICKTPVTRYRRLARRLSRRTTAALRGRSSIVGLAVADRRTRITCGLHTGWHFASASVVKVTILGALLRKLQAEHKYLTPAQVTLTTEMITESDNDAASALWAQVGRWHLQRFLDLAKMNHTQLGPGGYWGLTQINAHDELTLLKLLTSNNHVLRRPERRYALGLMARVVSWQRWGTPAGVRPGITVHVKNGWLPLATYGWRINSLGAFSGRGRSYQIVILTKNNPTMDYGIDTIQAAAEVINRDLG
ncbi:MAG: serine hydrolase [Streptosporangiaceae bacterium]|jgi:hypothetical protein